MNEFFRRLSLRPRLAWEIMLASFFTNLMSLASPVYVIMVLNRYVGYGFDGTLVTLTFGVLIASALGFGFGEVRDKLAKAVSVEPDRELGERTLNALARAKLTGLQRIGPGRHQEVLTGLQTIQSAYEPGNIAHILDAPFLALFLVAIVLLSPLLAVLTLVAIVLSAAFTLSSVRQVEENAEKVRDVSVANRNLVLSAVASADTVRAFLGVEFLRKAWRRQITDLAALRGVGDALRTRSRMRSESVAVLMRVLVYTVGAMQAVAGDMSVGALIGISILSSKAMQLSSTFLQSYMGMRKAEDAGKLLAEFHSLPLEPVSGTALRNYTGSLEFADVGFAYPGSPGPLFESLTFKLQPGSVLAVTGFNGSGKTTFCKLAAGLVEPGRGQILADGVDLRQFAPDWWRRQVLYLPQEPTFLNATLRENILLSVQDPEAPDVTERLNQATRAASLRRFLDVSRSGLDMDIQDSGRTLPVGIRRRVALARTLMNQGRIAIFDDPTEGLDSEGCQAVYGVLNALAKQQVSIIVVTSDPNILKAAGYVMDMNTKPTPVIGVLRQPKSEDAP